jgi:CHAD domain-containing protein
MSRFDWNERATPGANARRELSRMLADYFAEVRAALARKASPASLHKIRLASKKVRYTLELFAPCYGADFAARMQALKDVQTALGEVNDAVAAERLIGDSMPRSERRKALRAFLKNRAAEKSEEFRVHWMERFDAEGCERRWREVLASPRARTAPKSRRANQNNARLGVS